MPVYIATKNYMHGVKHILPQAGNAVDFANWRWIGCLVHWAIQANCWRKEISVEEVGGSVETVKTEFAVGAGKTGRLGRAVPSILRIKEIKQHET